MGKSTRERVNSSTLTAMRDVKELDDGDAHDVQGEDDSFATNEFHLVERRDAGGRLWTKTVGRPAVAGWRRGDSPSHGGEPSTRLLLSRG